MISQLHNKRNHQGGNVRKMGDTTARKLERGMDKPIGWMDIDHSSATLDGAELVMIQTYRALTADQREVLMLTASEYARLNRGGDAPPPTTATRPKGPAH